MNGRRWIQRLVLAVSGAALAVPALAQVPVGRAEGKGPDAETNRRYQVAVMERVLEQAVHLGVRVVTRGVRTSSPDMLFSGGTAQARGFRLDDYGVVFDVSVPSMNASVIWISRILEGETAGAKTALQTFRNLARKTEDPALRRDLDEAVRQIELQMAPYGKPADEGPVTAQVRRTGGTAVVVSPGAPVAAPKPVPPIEARAAGGAGMTEPAEDDPEVTYTTEVRNALIAAMLDHSHALSLGPEEWLAIAAHDDGDRMSVGDPYERATMVIRIKGADLLALRSGKMTREEARQRVEVKNY